MFEFEKQIMKAERRFPLVGYSYKVVPKTKKAEFSFAKWNKFVHRIMSESEQKKFITENLDLKRSPFMGVVKVHEDIKENEVDHVIKHSVLRNLAEMNVPGIEYSDPSGRHKYVCLTPLKYEKDFVIEVVEKITYDEEPKKLTFDDIKAL